MSQRVLTRSSFIKGVTAILLGAPILSFAAGCSSKGKSTSADTSGTENEATNAENTYTGTAAVVSE